MSHFGISFFKKSLFVCIVLYCPKRQCVLPVRCVCVCMPQVKLVSTIHPPISPQPSTILPHRHLAATEVTTTTNHNRKGTEKGLFALAGFSWVDFFCLALSTIFSLKKKTKQDWKLYDNYNFVLPAKCFIEGLGFALMGENTSVCVGVCWCEL